MSQGLVFVGFDYFLDPNFLSFPPLYLMLYPFTLFLQPIVIAAAPLLATQFSIPFNVFSVVLLL